MDAVFRTSDATGTTAAAQRAAGIVAVLLCVGYGTPATADDAMPRRGLTFGAGLAGGITGFIYSGSGSSARQSATGGGVTALGRLGYFFSPTFAVVLDTQLSTQWVSVRGNSISVIDGLVGVSALGYVEEQTYLMGGVGLSAGERSDADSSGKQSSGLGAGLTVGGGRELVEFGRWALAGEFRFTVHMLPSSALSVTMLQGLAGVGIYRR